MPVVDYANMPVELRDGWRATNDWVHGLTFEPELLSPGDFIPDGNSAHVPALAARWPAVSFPASPTSSAFACALTRSQWIDGSLKFTLWYSGSAASTNTIGWELLTAGRDAGEALDSHDIQFLQAMAGPAAVNGILMSDFTTQLAITAADKLIDVRISRTTPDAYAGTAYLLGVKLTYIPNKL